MSNSRDMTPEMKVVWDRFRKGEDPTEKELEALYLALKEKKSKNAESDLLKKIDDPAYSRPKCCEGLDDESEAETFSLLNGFTHEKFEKYGKDVIRALHTVYYYTG